MKIEYANLRAERVFRVKIKDVLVINTASKKQTKEAV